jgi:hypothetical protein
MKKEYWRVAFIIIPNGCQPITYTAVISEPVEKFIRRNKKNDEFQTFVLIMTCMCGEGIYSLYKQFNPAAGEGCYAKFKKEDYSKSKK